MSRHSTVKWAQRSDKLYLTVELPDAKDVKLELEPEGKFFFSAASGADKTPYEIDIDLLYNVDVNLINECTMVYQESKASVGLRNIHYLIQKAEKKWWSRLLKQEGKPPVFLKVDWDKWIDEDEEYGSKVEPDMDFGDIDFSKLNMGGGGDFDVDGADEEDEEDVSDTEEEKSDEAPAVEGAEVDAEKVEDDGSPEVKA